MTDEPKDGGTWRDRKKAIRERYYKTLKTIGSGGEPGSTPASPGAAPTRTVSDLDPSAWGVEPPRASSGTSVTATAPPTDPSSPSVSTTPAANTSNSSASSMVWMVAPSGFVELNLTKSIVDPSGSLMPGLPASVHASLQALATARHEPVEAVIEQIAQWFVEAEDERAEGPLVEALAFYCANYVGPQVTV